jgi:hypothetical protein
VAWRKQQQQRPRANEVCAAAAFYQGHHAEDTVGLKAVTCFVLIANQIEPCRLKKVSFVLAPHTLDIGRIVRDLNRIRVELVGEFLLTIR